MRTLLINLEDAASQNGKHCVIPPLGLWSIREHVFAFEADIFDFNIPREGMPAFACYDLIGLSARFSNQDKQYRELAKKANDLGKLVLVGGQHAWYSQLPRNAVKATTQYRHPLIPSSVLEVYWNIDKPHDFKSRTKNWLPIVTSTGCFRSCNYCASKNYWGRQSVVPYTMEYIDTVHQAYGIKEFFIEDDNFFFLKHARNVLEFLEEHGIWYSFPNGADIRTAHSRRRLMQHCWRIALPFETGCLKTAQAMNIGTKYFDFKEAYQVVKDFNEQGIETCGFFIIGYPGETKEDVKQTLHYANALPLHERHIYFATPYPGTNLYEYCKVQHFLLYDEPKLYERLSYVEPVIDTPWLSAKDLQELREEDRKRALEDKYKNRWQQTYALKEDLPYER